MIDVLVIGALGKMGSLTARTLAAQEDLRVAGLVDPKFGAGDAPPPPVDAPAVASSPASGPDGGPAGGRDGAAA